MGGGGGERTISEQRPQEAEGVSWGGELEARYTQSDLWTHGTLLPLPGSIVCLELVYVTCVVYFLYICVFIAG